MKKYRFPFALYCIFIFALMSISKESTERVQGFTVAILTPMWQQLFAIKSFVSTPRDTNQTRMSEEQQKLQLDNTLLKTEIAYLKEKIEYEIQLLEELKKTNNNESGGLSFTKFIEENQSQLQRIAEGKLQALPARVIFRPPASWNQFLWIDIGETANGGQKAIAIAKNSPVVVGNAIIGVVDFVGQDQARVRLVTDPGLNASVRVQRDGIFLAKGEIHGSGKPHHHTEKALLAGTGFNYDYEDEAGPARDLRTGEAIGAAFKAASIHIVKNGDLLVTTGMDGVFPPNLSVARVTHVFPLKEGDYFYELDAVPTAGNLHHLSLVFVLPPLQKTLEEFYVTDKWN